jgi:hypothetical protein
MSLLLRYDLPRAGSPTCTMAGSARGRRRRRRGTDHREHDLRLRVVRLRDCTGDQHTRASCGRHAPLPPMPMTERGVPLAAIAPAPSRMLRAGVLSRSNCFSLSSSALCYACVRGSAYMGPIAPNDGGAEHAWAAGRRPGARSSSARCPTRA